jgi:enoyl-CoA hydratase/carnithine racemase
MTEVVTDLNQGIATVTLNRPTRRNALTIAAATLLDQTLRTLDADPEVHCMVVIGAGPAFCSGDDMGQWDTEELSDFLGSFAVDPPQIPMPLAALVDCGTPVIAAVNGAALGAGMDLALLCDLRIASTEAYFAQTYVRYGLSAHIGGLWRLPQLVGPALAAELLYTGRRLSAVEALTCGLVSRVVQPDELMASARELAQAIAESPPSAVRAIKEGLRRAANTKHGELAELAGWASRALVSRLGELTAHPKEPA